jgi:hypothetical protein
MTRTDPSPPTIHSDFTEVQRTMNPMRLFRCLQLSILCLLNVVASHAQESISLEQQLKSIDAALLAKESRLRGNPKRGAIVFYMSAAGCVKCHQGGLDSSPLGPDLATIGREATDQYVIESLLCS